MRIVEIKTIDNGSHNNQIIDGATPDTFPIPEGWAVIPENVVCENFPFGEVETAVVDGIMTVTKWILGDIPEPEAETFVEQQIADLKAQLVSTDYKVIKCSEAQLVGEAMPYDIVALHEERQKLRDKINELERVGE